MPKRKTVDTFTLILIGTDGSQTPIGDDGAAAFHPFHIWPVALGAVVNAISRTGGRAALAEIEALAVTTTQVSAAGKLLLLTWHKFSRDEVREIYDGAYLRPGVMNVTTDLQSTGARS